MNSMVFGRVPMICPPRNYSPIFHCPLPASFTVLFFFLFSCTKYLNYSPLHSFHLFYNITLTNDLYTFVVFLSPSSEWASTQNNLPHTLEPIIPNGPIKPNLTIIYKPLYLYWYPILNTILSTLLIIFLHSTFWYINSQPLHLLIIQTYS